MNASATLSRARRVTIGVILAIALITGFGAVMSTWVKRQVLDTGNWTNTSAKLIENKKIQVALGTYIVDELFNRVDVAGELRSVLPKQASGLAAPVSAGLRQVATQAMPQILARPRVQDAWRTANDAGHAQLVKILNGGGNVVSTQQGEVALNLRAFVDQLAGTLGVKEQVASARQKLQGGTGTAIRGAAQQRLGVTLPNKAGKLVIMRSDQLTTAQDVAKGIKGLSIALTIISLSLFGLVIWLGRGARRVMLRRVGWSFVAIGIVALIARRLAGNNVVDGLVQAESVKPAAHDAWMIATSLLFSIAVSMVIYGAIIVFCAWLAGSTRVAVGTRRALAPTLREHPGRAYAALAGVYLLVLLWGPTPAFRNFLPIVLIAGLLVLGLEVLRRQTQREFPTAQAGDTARAFREWRASRKAGGAAAQPAPTGDGNGHGHVDELERLAALHDRGILSDAEFESEKAVLISHA